MIKVKITSVGGYVVGDGPLPKGLNPDRFLIAFGKRVLEAQREGLEELEFTDAEIEAYLKAAGEHIEQAIMDAPVHELPNKALKDVALMPLPAPRRVGVQ